MDGLVDRATNAFARFVEDEEGNGHELLLPVTEEELIQAEAEMEEMRKNAEDGRFGL